MGVEVAQPLRLKRGAGRPIPLDQSAKPRRRVSTNALLGMGLWVLLWLGYNTDPWYVMDPNFPANTTDLIHGLRAFSPMLAAWFACAIDLRTIKAPVSLDHGSTGVDVIVRGHGIDFFRDPIA